MPSHDVSKDPRSEPDHPEIPPTIIAHSDDDGVVTIYDEDRRTAWISSTCAVSRRNVA